MEVKIRNRSQNSALDESTTQEISFLSKFVEESKKYQTLHATLAGFRNRCIFDIKDKDSIEKYLAFYLCYTEKAKGKFFQKNIPTKIQNVKDIMNKIYEVRQQHIKSDEIHFFIIWNYYYDHNSKTMESTPVFKVFKSNDGNRAAFIDVYLKVYSSWNNYLDHALLPPCLMCVPQNGVYVMDDYSPNLEYLASNSCLEYLTLKQENKLITSQYSISPWIQKLQFNLNLGNLNLKYNFNEALQESLNVLRWILKETDLKKLFSFQSIIQLLEWAYKLYKKEVTLKYAAGKIAQKIYNCIPTNEHVESLCNLIQKIVPLGSDYYLFIFLCIKLISAVYRLGIQYRESRNKPPESEMISTLHNTENFGPQQPSLNPESVYLKDILNIDAFMYHFPCADDSQVSLFLQRNNCQLKHSNSDFSHVVDSSNKVIGFVHFSAKPFKEAICFIKSNSSSIV